MPASFRSIGKPTDDALENARRGERSAWWSLVHSYEALAEVPAGHESRLEFERARVEKARAAWAEALRALDGLLMSD